MRGERDYLEISINLVSTTNYFRCFTLVDDAVIGCKSSRTGMEGLAVKMA